jgi:hypothetical protein
MRFRCFTGLAMALTTLLGFPPAVLPEDDPAPFEAGWIAEPVTIDGSMAEWIDRPMVTVADPGLMLSIGHDSRFLYILMRFKEISWARTIRLSGLALWFDTPGEEEERLGMRYRGGLAPSDMEKPSRGSHTDMWDLMPRTMRQQLMEYLSQEEQIILVDKAKNLETVLPVDGSMGPAAAFESIPGTYTYEFALPIGEEDGDRPAFPLRPGQTIRLGFKWGMEKEDIDQMKEEMERRMREGPGRYGGGSWADRMPKPEKQAFRLQIRLAEEPAPGENTD